LQKSQTRPAQGLRPPFIACANAKRAGYELRFSGQHRGRFDCASQEESQSGDVLVFGHVGSFDGRAVLAKKPEPPACTCRTKVVAPRSTTLSAGRQTPHSKISGLWRITSERAN